MPQNIIVKAAKASLTNSPTGSARFRACLYERTFSSMPIGSEIEKCMNPTPRSPAITADSGCVPDIQIGGGGFCTGFGKTVRGGTSEAGEPHEARAWVPIWRNL